MDKLSWGELSEMRSGASLHQGYTASRARPLLRRALMTRCPVLVRIRTRKPEVLLRLRLVPSRVRLVMVALSYISEVVKKSQSIIIPLNSSGRIG